MPRSAAMEHLDPDTLAAYVDGRLAVPELGRADRHIDTCASCRIELSALAATASQPRSGSPGNAPEGAVGRYKILRELGRGAMGIVLRAFDPELQRPVALKLLRDVDRELLRREARALAKLRHPNVVSVYDAVSEGEELYVAMELVEGDTLRAYCKGKPLREVLATCIAAGRGLAAAHDAGVIHRDFKPENVLCTAGGEARVSDFGLARTGEEADGMFAGTPAYMAPEVLRREPATAASDQYSYCVAVYELVEGSRPGENPSPTVMPARIWKVLRRGLSRDPAGRFPSMHAVLAALADDPAVRRRRAVMLAGGALVAIGIGAVAVRLLSTPARSCDVDGSALGDAWDDTRQGAVKKTLTAASDIDNAERSLAAVDAFAVRWREESRRACTSDSPLAARCLERSRRELGELTSLLATGSNSVAMRSQEAIGRLGDPAACAAADDVMPTDAVELIVAEHARVLLARAKALQSIGRVDDAEAIVRSVGPTVAGQPRLAAEVHLVEGRLANERAQPERAEQTLFAGLREAERGRDDTLVAAIWVELVMAEGAQAQRFELAQSNMHAADAALARVVPGSDLQLRYDYTVGTMLMAHGKVDEARTRLVQGLEHAGSDARRRVQVGQFQLALCDVERQANKLPVAREHCDRGIEALEQAFGPDHLRVGVSLSQVGALAFTEHDLPSAEKTFKRSIAIFEKQGARDHLAYAVSKANLGAVYATRGDVAAAKVQFEDALALFNKYRPDHPQKQFALQGLAGIALRAGDTEHAIDYYRQVRDGMAKTYVPDSQQLLVADFNLAIALREKHPDESRKLAESIAERALKPGKEQWMLAGRALDHASTLAEDRKDATAAVALRERAIAALDHGAPDADRAFVRRNQGMTLLRMKRYADARKLLDKALELDLLEPDDPYEIGMARIGLALALHGIRTDAARALDLAKQASVDLAKAQTGEQLAYYRDVAAHFIKANSH